MLAQRWRSTQVREASKCLGRIGNPSPAGPRLTAGPVPAATPEEKPERAHGPLKLARWRYEVVLLPRPPTGMTVLVLVVDVAAGGRDGVAVVVVPVVAASLVARATSASPARMSFW